MISQEADDVPRSEDNEFDDSFDSDSQRLSRNEIRKRMLQVAVDRISVTGLMVGLDHLVLEELVDEAGVSRSSVHRIWGPKENFVNDVIIFLIDPGESVGAAFDQQTLDLARATIEQNRDRLVTPAGRVELLRETVRLATEQNFEAIRQSVHWRSHVALSCAGGSLSDEHRERIQDALQRVEGRFIERMSAFYELMLAYFQREPRPGVTTSVIAAAGAAVVEGLVVKANLIPDIIEHRIVLPGLDDDAEWHLAAAAFLGVIEVLTVPISTDPVERTLV